MVLDNGRIVSFFPLPEPCSVFTLSCRPSLIALRSSSGMNKGCCERWLMGAVTGRLFSSSPAVNRKMRSLFKFRLHCYWIYNSLIVHWTLLFQGRWGCCLIIWGFSIDWWETRVNSQGGNGDRATLTGWGLLLCSKYGSNVAFLQLVLQPSC